MKEREFVDIVERRWNLSKDRSVSLAVGDDAALVGDILISTDSMVEKYHFLESFASYCGEREFYKSLGFKVVSISVSDIVAMGGKAVAVLVSAGFPRGFGDEHSQLVLDGIAEAMELYGVSIVGGDTVSSPFLFLNSTVVGKKGRSLWVRNGAKAGDKIYLTGTVGLAEIGLRLLMGKSVNIESEKIKKSAVEKFLKPEARCQIVDYLHRFKITSAIDLSDGLVPALLELSRKSGKRFVVEEDKIPAVDVRGGIQMALIGGEDYEILFTSPDDINEKSFEKSTGVKLSLIGFVEGEGESEVVMKKQKGSVILDHSLGFEHRW